MLKVCTDTCGGQGRPHGVLVHGIGMLGPHGEVFRISGELFLQAFYDVLVFKKQNGSCSRLEHGQFLRSRLEPVGRNDGTQGIFGKLPQFLVFGTEKDDHTGGL